MKITAVVVTYNRLQFLKSCVETLKRQSLPPSTIIVVNNGSTDGTTEWLKQQPELIIKDQKNTGSSGGFSTGIKCAYELGADWVWIMDDDAFPNPDCLKNMVESGHMSANCDVVLAPIVVENGKIDFSHRGYINFDNLKNPLQTPIDKNLYIDNSTDIEVSFVSFVGMFVGKRIIESVGYPDSRYFIFNDDVEYSVRIIKSGFRMFLIKNAIVFHKFLPEEGTINFKSNNYGEAELSTDNTLYSKFKRKLKYTRLYDTLSERAIFAFVGKRNLVNIVQMHNSSKFKIAVFLSKSFLVSIFDILLSKTNKIRQIKLLYHSYKQGITNQYDTAKLLSYKD